jgi:zinc transporter ZupT
MKQANFFVDDDEVKLEQSKHNQLLKNKALINDSKKPSWIENMTPFVLMIGLGVHATFEGLSLGLSTDFDSTLLLATAIVLHKGAAGMSLGISMGKTFPGQDGFVTKLLVLFAASTPAGVVLGWLL